MKRFILYSLIGAFILTSTVVCAQEKVSFGPGNLALKVDYLQFTDERWAKYGDDEGLDSALYVGIEGYAETFPNLYLGLEAGFANPSSTIVRYSSLSGTKTYTYEITYIPIEANLKYAVALASKLYLGIGGGLSYNWAELKGTRESGGTSESKSIENWLFGGQFFIELNYKFERFFLGLNTKYQVTENFTEDILALDLSNLRIGGQIGFSF